MKREYKVGETIYVKGKIDYIDENDTSLPYRVDFVNGTVWAHSDNIIDELPTAEPVKPVLPKEVADELEIAKKSNFSFDVYIVQIISGNAAYYNSREFWINSDDGVIKTLMDAWHNGYTVEKEPTWCIEVPGKFNRPTYYAINDGALAFGYLDEDKKWYRDYSAHAFTDEEIKKYDLENFKKELITDDNED